MIISIYVTAVIGLVLSIYSVYVEKKYENNKSYKAVCDVNDKFSCTKAFSSRYGRLAGISNSAVGIIFYIIILALNFYNINYVFYLSILSFLGVIYLAYLQYIKMKNFCIVCTGIYIVNLLLLIFSYFEVF